MSTSRPEFTEEELRALEAEMEQLTVDDVLLQTLVTLINLGARKAGLAAPPGEEPPERDLEQTRQAIDGARALLPLLEAAPRRASSARSSDALSRLQMAYVQLSGGGAAPAAGAGERAAAAEARRPGPGADAPGASGSPGSSALAPPRGRLPRSDGGPAAARSLDCRALSLVT